MTPKIFLIGSISFTIASVGFLFMKDTGYITFAFLSSGMICNYNMNLIQIKKDHNVILNARNMFSTFIVGLLTIAIILKLISIPSTTEQNMLYSMVAMILITIFMIHSLIHLKISKEEWLHDLYKYAYKLAMKRTKASKSQNTDSAKVD